MWARNCNAIHTIQFPISWYFGGTWIPVLIPVKKKNTRGHIRSQIYIKKTIYHRESFCISTYSSQVKRQTLLRVTKKQKLQNLKVNKLKLDIWSFQVIQSLTKDFLNNSGRILVRTQDLGCRKCTDIFAQQSLLIFSIRHGTFLT